MCQTVYWCVRRREQEEMMRHVRGLSVVVVAIDELAFND